MIAGTLAFMLAKDEGRFLRIKPSEIEPLRESLHFLREKNVHVRTFWTSWEKFQNLWKNIQVPAGTGKLRVRASRGGRARGRAGVEQTLGETLGEEEAALVIIDPKEMPRTWAEVGAAENIGECVPRPEEPAPAEAPAEAGPGGGGDPERHAVRTAAASRAVQETSYVTLGDPHLDAKLFPHLHPYGSGSLRAEEGAGGIQRQARSRLTALDPGFRDCPVWQFFNRDRLTKSGSGWSGRRPGGPAPSRQKTTGGPAGEGNGPERTRTGTLARPGAAAGARATRSASPPTCSGTWSPLTSPRAAAGGTRSGGTSTRSRRTTRRG